MKKILLLVAFAFLSSGCFGHPPVKKDKHQSPLVVTVTGNCVNKTALKEARKLGILAFKAGPQAEANDTLDHLSAILIKGIQERLALDTSSVELTNQESKANIILEGYIEEYSKPGRFSRLVMRKKNSRLAVSGEIWIKGSGLKALTFASSIFIGPKVSVDEMAYQMGQGIGDFILEKIK